jgi:hypothetical protein
MPPTVSGHRFFDQRFELEAEHGRGGMGTVWKARDRQTQGWVALKLLHDQTPEQTERFVREGGLLAQLSHPNIVGYVAHGQSSEGTPYLAMEWLEGENLAQRLERGRLDLLESTALLRSVLGGLAAVHSRGIVHRDLKPSNLFLRGRSVDDVVLLDLGLARRFDSSQLTRTGSILGTPSYMPPEQVQGRLELAPSADVFSLGCVLFECLTGQPPFVGTQLITVLAKIVFEAAPRLRDLRPELPEPIERLLDRMLSKDPALRPCDALALRAALDALGQMTEGTARSNSRLRLRPLDEEQELVSVILATSAGTPGEARAPATETATWIAGAPDRLDVSAYGAEYQALADGTVVVTLGQHGGVATDLAARAARCALRLQALRPSWIFVLATGHGTPNASSYIGEAVERAGVMLHAHRESGTPGIWLDELTTGLLDARFVTSRLSQAIVVFALHGEDPSMDPARPLLGRPTPCVGRDHEIGMLDLTLRACIEESRPRAMLVLGAAGIGKSRVRHEFARHVARAGHAVTQWVGLGDPIRSAGGCGLLGSALARLSGLRPELDEDAKRAALAERIGRNVPESERQRTVAFIGELCGVAPAEPMSTELQMARQNPNVMADRVSQAWLSFLRAELERGPILIVLDDLHWCDALTISLVGQALRELVDHPLMVLALGRPETAELFSDLWSPRLQTLPLQPLGAVATRRLVRQVLGEAIEADSVERIVTLAAGNALYVEELIRAADAKRDAIPQTVVAMLQARIALLPAPERRLLRAASVFGERFALPAVEALLAGTESGAFDLAPVLESLRKHEILEQSAEDRSERRWRFRHALARDAAYGLIKAEDVGILHMEAACFLEAIDEESAVIAEHYERGGEPARAIGHYIAAAEQAARHNDLAATLALVQRGLRCGVAGEQRGVLRSIAARAHYGGWDFDAGWEASSEALQLLPVGHPKRLESLGAQAYSGIQLGKADQLEAQIEELIAADPDNVGRGYYLHSLGYCSISQVVSGRRAVASRLLDRISEVDAAGEDADPFARGIALYWQLRYAQFLGDDLYAAYRFAQRGVAVNERSGNRRFLAFARIQLAECTRHLFSVTQGIAEMRRAAQLVADIADPAPALFVNYQLSALLAENGADEEVSEARALARRAMETAGNGHGYLALARLSLALSELRAGALEQAEQHALEAQQTLQKLGMRACFPQADRTLLRVLVERGETRRAGELADAALSTLEHFGPFGIAETPLRLAAARAYLAARRPADALQCARAALERVQRQAEKIDDLEIRSAFLDRLPENVELRALASTG